MLLHFPHAPWQSFDAGIVRSSEETASYVTQIVGAVPHLETSGLLGPFELGPDRVLELHEFQLPVGVYDIRLVNESGGTGESAGTAESAGTVDWGLAVHGGERPYQNRLAGMDLDARWANGRARTSRCTSSSGRRARTAWRCGSAAPRTCR